MMTAQKLYEGIELGAEGSVGLITYMRTDSVRIAAEALNEAREYIHSQYDAPYLPPKARVFKVSGFRPGRPRSDPADGGPSVAPADQGVPHARPVPPLPAHLEPFSGLPDEPGRSRPDHSRHRRRQLPFPCAGLGDEVSRIHRRLHGGQRGQRR